MEIHEFYTGLRYILPSNGPMGIKYIKYIGRSVDDLTVMMRVLLDSDAYEKAPSKSKFTYFIPRPFNT